MQIGKKISLLRKNKGLTQKELADLLSVTDKAISRWESGVGNPDLDTIPKIASCFGVTTDYLLSDQEGLPELPTQEEHPISKEEKKEAPRNKKKWTIATAIAATVLLGAGLGIGIPLCVRDSYNKDEYAKGIGYLESGEYEQAKVLFGSLSYSDSWDKSIVAWGMMKLEEAKNANSQGALAAGIELIITGNSSINTHYEGNGRPIRNEDYRFDEILNDTHRSLYSLDDVGFSNWSVQSAYFYQNNAFLYLTAIWK